MELPIEIIHFHECECRFATGGQEDDFPVGCFGKQPLDSQPVGFKCQSLHSPCASRSMFGG
ncbi:MAG: hypothetical protein KY476_03815 [Planctomycetes bacterium]|nr:hypothetical protein [Planctomycetota bacterium]